MSFSLQLRKLWLSHSVPVHSCLKTQCACVRALSVACPESGENWLVVASAECPALSRELVLAECSSPQL